MNKTRRQEISRIYEELENLKSSIDLVMEDEQSAYDNLPESLQDSDRGEKMYDAIDALDSAMSSVDEAMESLLTAAE